MEYSRRQVHSSAFSSLYLARAPDRNEASDVCCVGVWRVEEAPDDTVGHDAKPARALCSLLAERTGGGIVGLRSSVYLWRQQLFWCLLHIMRLPPVSSVERLWQLLNQPGNKTENVQSEPPAFDGLSRLFACDFILSGCIFTFQE